MTDSFSFFFFQAEDGIRDGHVTGVQTCALPIWWALGPHSSTPPRSPTATSPPSRNAPPRSEERRVGKECRSRWSPYQKKKKKKKKRQVKKSRKEIIDSKMDMRTDIYN